MSVKKILAAELLARVVSLSLSACNLAISFALATGIVIFIFTVEFDS